MVDAPILRHAPDLLEARPDHPASALLEDPEAKKHRLLQQVHTRPRILRHSRAPTITVSIQDEALDKIAAELS